jgi:hypothetical protein
MWEEVNGILNVKMKLPYVEKKKKWTGKCSEMQRSEMKRYNF